MALSHTRPAHTYTPRSVEPAAPREEDPALAWGNAAMAEQISASSAGECPSVLGDYTSMFGEETSSPGTCEPDWATDGSATATASRALEELASAILAPRPDGAMLFGMAMRLEGRDLVRLRDDEGLWTRFLSVIGPERASGVNERLAVLEDIVVDDDRVFFARAAMREEIASDIRAALERALESSEGAAGTHRVPSGAVRHREIVLGEETAGNSGFHTRTVTVQMTQGTFSMSLRPIGSGRVAVNASGSAKGVIAGHPLAPEFEERWNNDFFATFVGGFWVFGEPGEVVWRL